MQPFSFSNFEPNLRVKVAANLMKSKVKHYNNNNKTKAFEFSPSPLKATTMVFLFMFVSREFFLRVRK